MCRVLTYAMDSGRIGKGGNMKATICPVCEGGGSLCVSVIEGCLIPVLKTCHGCGGKGWVVIPEVVVFKGKPGDSVI